MNLQTYFSALAAGVELVSACGSKAELVRLGASPDHADELVALHAVYFGETTFSGKQRECRGTAHDLHTLQRIERHVRKVKDKRLAWDLRCLLCATSAADIDSVARARLAELNPRPVPTPGVKVRKGKGLWKLTVTAPSELLSDVAKVQDGTAETFAATFFDGHARPDVTVNVVVELDTLDEILDGRGDETIVRCTNGATMTGAQLLQRRLTAHGYAALVHPVAGPVDLGRLQRTANFKQRKLCEIENPTCSWPDCTCPADESQVHHLQDWKSGGETNISNLLMLCKYHNGVNEDSGTANAPPVRRGRMTKVRGKSAWIPPGGGRPIITFEGYTAQNPAPGGTGLVRS